MRRVSLVLALASLLLTDCSSEDVSPIEDPIQTVLDAGLDQGTIVDVNRMEAHKLDIKLPKKIPDVCYYPCDRCVYPCVEEEY